MSDGMIDKSGGNDDVQIGPIPNDASFRLVSAPNGGWIVSAGSLSMGEMDKVVGAYTTPAEMLDALRSVLVT